MNKQPFVVASCLLALLALATGVLAGKQNMGLTKAREAAVHGEWDEAARLAQDALKDTPNDESVWSLIGDAQMALGDTQSALSAYERSLELYPKQTNSLLALTGYYVDRARIPDAERIVSAAEAKDPRGRLDEIKVARGEILAATGKMPEATRILASAAAKNPKNPLYPQILARIYLTKKVTDLAEKYFADAWNLAPGDPVLAFDYAKVLLEQKKYNEALDLFKVVQEKDPNNKTVDYLIGRLYFAANRYAEAAAQFEKAVDKRPDHFLSFFLLGRCYLEFSKQEKKNFYGLAEKNLRSARALKPDRTDVDAFLAEAVVSQGKLFYQRALADTVIPSLKAVLGPEPWAIYVDSVNATQRALLDSARWEYYDALTIAPSTPGVFAQLARTWYKIGNLDSSIYYSRRHLELNPGDDTELRRLVNSLQKQKNQAGLAEVLKPRSDRLDWTKSKAPGDTAKTPEDVFLDAFAAVYTYALIETGQSSLAREALKAMLAYNPAWCDGYGLSANIDLRRQNYGGALPTLLAGVRACPTDKELWLSLGDSYYFSDPKNKDNVQKAKDSYLRARQLGSTEAAEKYGQLNR